LETSPPLPLNELLERHRPRITAALRARISSRLRPHVDAEDLWQETALQALDGATFEWRGDAAFQRWLLTLGARALSAVARRVLGRDFDRPDVGELDSVAEAIVRESTGPATSAERRDEVLRVMGAIKVLPEVQREVLCFDLVQMMTYDEMAAATGRTKAALAQAHLRALRAVRTVLGNPTGGAA
jgi:RNA polymerase sigma factor (sigma-70 family)